MAAIIGGIVLLLVVLVIILYNQLVVWRLRVRNAWSQVEVQLRMRYDLVPNLVETVKGYAAHEKQVFAAVTEARAKAIGAGGAAGKAEAEEALSGALRSLFAVAEAYPQLKANENFTELQKQLQEVEKKIAFSRQFYNDTVLRYNAKIGTFPTLLVAGAFSFKPEAYFEAGAEAQGPVSVKF